MGEWHVIHRRYKHALPYIAAAIEHAPKRSRERDHAEKMLDFVRYEPLAHRICVGENC